MLPGTWISPSTSSFSLVTSSSTSPLITRVSFHSGSVRVLESTYFGMLLYLSAKGPW